MFEDKEYTRRERQIIVGGTSILLLSGCVGSVENAIEAENIAELAVDLPITAAFSAAAYTAASAILGRSREQTHNN